MVFRTPQVKYAVLFMFSSLSAAAKAHAEKPEKGIPAFLACKYIKYRSSPEPVIGKVQLNISVGYERYISVRVLYNRIVN